MAVAYSGGRDSTALLHATLKASLGLGIEVLALHVHHGLSPQADAWEAHCEAQCARWARRGLPVELIAHRLASKPEAGDSVEAWARSARYRALREMALARHASIVLLAHHRRDQAETLLLQALRGAGLAGLSAMPASVQREAITWVRPWLAQPREHIDAYVRRNRLRHIDDESNGEPRFARNRLRLQVWPVLVAAFPQAEASLAAAAEWARQAADALNELAALDLDAVAGDDDGLHLASWQALSAARRSNALRAWLKARLGRPASASLVERLTTELIGSRTGSRWPVDAGELSYQRGVLRYATTTRAVLPAVDREATLSVQRAGSYALPGWGGWLEVRPVAEGGVPKALLERLDLRSRAGGETFQAGIGRPPRSLKKQYQTAGVPPRERQGPLIYSGGRLVYVPGLGLDARQIGAPGQKLVGLCWRPTDTSALRSGDDTAQS